MMRRMTHLLSVFIAWLLRVGCAHDDILFREDGRLMLECLKCGRKTSGFKVG